MTRVESFDRRTGSLRQPKMLALLVYLAAVAAVALVGSIATRDGQGWYDALEKPAFTPPDWVFGPVWTTLYIAMAVAAWLVHRTPGARAALGVWWLQLGLNLAWSWLFFGFEMPGVAALEIGALLAAITVTIVLLAPRSRWAAGLMVPYFFWVCFAAALNFEVWRLNS